MEHITVLKGETIDSLEVKKNKIYVDATLGGGGHSEEILKRLSNSGHLYAFDQDIYAINESKKRLAHFKNFTPIQANFKDLEEELIKRGVSKIDGIVFDLGLSSFQIDDKERGFSYLMDNDLDMRMDQSALLSAKDIVNDYSYEELVSIFFAYGEEKNARSIAKEIIKRRPITRTSELVEITDKINYNTKGHSAKRVFQALRIEVNKELDVLKKALEDGVKMLNKGGRMAVITFHSLEDKIVKHFFKKESETNVPKNLMIIDLPVPNLRKITNKPILPSEEEINANSRSRSAKLRVVEKN
ncbi:16S rRNA (cytosine(1402)-N(4))-methyltransferase RsmH [Acholeplasma sp. OttesenSCG-928-E16]|nr:16S rRNA (cytosine(1402)-N(4))-methyltransferase RsmH [Acholeplasma sp. OttesenSCG-928-E16]